MRYGAVEGGGTKFRCAAGDGIGRRDAEAWIETSTPEATLGEVAAFFRDHRVSALGVGMFGPLDLRTGRTRRTPKPGWSDVPVREQLESALGVPVLLDTDVNVAALAETELGAGRGYDPVVYLTVGTGIGGGAIVNGRALRGAMHPEMGHVTVPARAGDDWRGICPFHERCAEGLASGPALLRRWGHLLGDDDDEAWSVWTSTIGQLVATIALVLSPQRFVLGGGVPTPRRVAEVHRHANEALTGYVAGVEVVSPALGADAGLLGAFLLARSR